MERRALLRSLGTLALGGLVACGPRPTSSSPDPAAGVSDDMPRRPSVDRAAEGAEAPPGTSEQPGDATSHGDGETTPAPREVAVICREALGLAVAAAPAATHRPRRLTLHHTAVPLEAAALAPARLRQHQRHHLEQGWSDIAYHYAVDLAGNAYELRDPRVPGDTFTDYDTRGHLQVVCEGSFDRQRPTDALLDGLAHLLAGLAGEQGLDPASLDTHRAQVPTTRCPGEHLQARLEDLRLETTRLLGAGGAALVRRCGAAGSELVAEIEAG